MSDVYNGLDMVGDKKEEQKEEKKATTTVLVHEEEKKKGKFPGRLVLIYVLLLAAGIFVGIIFRLATR